MEKKEVEVEDGRGEIEADTCGENHLLTLVKAIVRRLNKMKKVTRPDIPVYLVLRLEFHPNTLKPPELEVEVAVEVEPRVEMNMLVELELEVGTEVDVDVDVKYEHEAERGAQVPVLVRVLPREDWGGNNVE